MRTDRGPAASATLASQALVLADGGAKAIFTFAFSAVMFADTAPMTFAALTSSATVLTDSSTLAVHTLPSAAFMLTDARPVAFFAIVAFALVPAHKCWHTPKRGALAH